MLIFSSFFAIVDHHLYINCIRFIDPLSFECMAQYYEQDLLSSLHTLSLQEKDQKKLFKTEQHYRRQRKRRQRTQQLNNSLSIKPIFTALHPYDIIHIHHTTSIEFIYDLIDLAQHTYKFTIDTETDKKSHQPALIQIEFVDGPQSIVLLIETCHLPDESSLLFGLIQSLLNVIFKPSNTILSWGHAMDELIKFLPYHIINWDTLDQLHFINIQDCFKKWYNDTMIHKCGLQYNIDHCSCTCSYRPYKRNHDKWSLQQAIAYTFNEFLNKHCTFSNWTQGLDDYLHHDYSSHCHRQYLIQYAVNDCLAVTKLAMVITNNWSLKQLQEHNVNSYISK